MKRLVLWFVCVTIAAGVGTAYAIHESTPAESFFPLPGAEAGALYRYITREDPYTAHDGDWSLWPGKGRLYKGRAPHGAFLTTYVNELARYSMALGKAMVNGSIIVKENYSPAKKLSAVTVMYKIKGYNPDGGNWFWAKYDPSGNVLKAGKVGGCIACHGGGKDNDYILTGKFVGVPLR